MENSASVVYSYETLEQRHVTLGEALHSASLHEAALVQPCDGMHDAETRKSAGESARGHKVPITSFSAKFCNAEVSDPFVDRRNFVFPNGCTPGSFGLTPLHVALGNSESATSGGCHSHMRSPLAHKLITLFSIDDAVATNFSNVAADTFIHRSPPPWLYYESKIARMQETNDQFYLPSTYGANMDTPQTDSYPVNLALRNCIRGTASCCVSVSCNYCLGITRIGSA